MKALDSVLKRSHSGTKLASLFTQSVPRWSNDGSVEQKEKYGIFSVQWAIKAIIWEPLFVGSAPPRYGGEQSRDDGRGSRGWGPTRGRKHQTNENQKYGAINTTESIHLPPPFLHLVLQIDPENPARISIQFERNLLLSLRRPSGSLHSCHRISHYIPLTRHFVGNCRSWNKSIQTNSKLWHQVFEEITSFYCSRLLENLYKFWHAYANLSCIKLSIFNF